MAVDLFLWVLKLINQVKKIIDQENKVGHKLFITHNAALLLRRLLCKMSSKRLNKNLFSLTAFFFIPQKTRW